MGIGARLYRYDVVKKSSRSLFHLLMSSCNKSSAAAEMGDRGHNRQGSKRRGGLLCPFPSNTMRPGSRSTSVPSGVFIHPAV